MYNSLVVRYLAKLWDVFTVNYEESLVKKSVNIIRKVVELLFRGSFVKNIFVSKKGFIDSSIFYIAYSFTLDILGKILKSCNLYFKRIGEHSLVYKNTKSLFRNDKELIRTVMVFVLFFGIGIIGINLTKGYFSGSSYIVAFGLVILSIVGLCFREDYKSILNNSLIYNLVKVIFTIDEGGDQWW